MVIPPHAGTGASLCSGLPKTEPIRFKEVPLYDRRDTIDIGNDTRSNIEVAGMNLEIGCIIGGILLLGILWPSLAFGQGFETIIQDIADQLARLRRIM